MKLKWVVLSSFVNNTRNESVARLQCDIVVDQNDYHISFNMVTSRDKLFLVRYFDTSVLQSCMHFVHCKNKKVI